jgi:hypothetical protein
MHAPAQLHHLSALRPIDGDTLYAPTQGCYNQIATPIPTLPSTRHPCSAARLTLLTLSATARISTAAAAALRPHPLPSPPTIPNTTACGGALPAATARLAAALVGGVACRYCSGGLCNTFAYLVLMIATPSTLPKFPQLLPPLSHTPPTSLATHLSQQHPVLEQPPRQLSNRGATVCFLATRLAGGVACRHSPVEAVGRPRFRVCRACTCRATVGTNWLVGQSTSRQDHQKEGEGATAASSKSRLICLMCASAQLGSQSREFAAFVAAT